MLEGLVTGLAQADRIFLRAYPETPWLYQSGVLYVENSPDVWTDIPAAMARGNGDCPTLCAWRMAELQLRAHLKVTPLVSVESRDRNGYYFHVRLVVTDPSRNPRVRVEDPSQILGM